MEGKPTVSGITGCCASVFWDTTGSCVERDVPSPLRTGMDDDGGSMSTVVAGVLMATQEVVEAHMEGRVVIARIVLYGT